MDKLKIIGGNPLKGTIRISGAKNAALPLITASILSGEPLRLSNVPQLADLKTLTALLEGFGITVQNTTGDQGAIMTLNAKNLTSSFAPYDLVRKMRASFLVLGPLLARTGHAEVSLPGGCAIGARPVAFHTDALTQMGAEIVIEEGYVKAKAPKGLQGADITFPVVSVTGTENILMAATLAKGTTRIFNAACEPEVTDLAQCLVKMGAKIDGIGTSTLTIEGVDRLSGAFHQILPDRIETGSYIMAMGMTGGEIRFENTSLDLLPGVREVLERTGMTFEVSPNGFIARSQKGQLLAQDIMTAPFPQYPTDLQAQFMSMMTLAQGTSIITENIFENRLMHVPELHRMGADITLNGNQATVKGVSKLTGAQVMATDLRASMALVIAGLGAQGETIVNRIYHLDRGYETLENKLKACGAEIYRLKEEDVDKDSNPAENENGFQSAQA